MNIASAISGSALSMNGTGLQNAISVRVARTALDNAQMQGDAAVSLIKAATPNRGTISPRPTIMETGQSLDLVG